jgi:hypothetical protein
MEHVVFHPGPDGSPAFRRFTSLEDAVRFVEHLRNVEGVSEVSVHALQPVPLAFRAYYRVEVPADAQPVEMAAVDPMPVDPMPVDPAPLAEVPAPSEPVMDSMPVAPEQPVAPVMAEPEFAEAGVAAEQPSNGKRSLGFFAH